MKILISRCLLGEPCRYDGQSKPSEKIEALRRAGHTLIPVCPEVVGGLPTPRPPAEVQPNGRVVNALGEDVTAQYRLGAELALALARREGCELAVLKAKSPSCGNRQIYDGTFTRTLVDGRGIAVRLLEQVGIRVINEEELDQLLGP